MGTPKDTPVILLQAAIRYYNRFDCIGKKGIVDYYYYITFIVIIFIFKYYHPCYCNGVNKE